MTSPGLPMLVVSPLTAAVTEDRPIRATSDVESAVMPSVVESRP